jgi:protein involved in polysaccharide export with SLBB domain
MESERGNQALAVSGTSAAGSAAAVSASREVSAALIARLSQIRATGRVVLKMRPDSFKIDDVPEISLENGDRFTVPPAPATVNIVGSVYDQNAFIFENGGTVRHYLQLAGGPTRSADRSRAFVIRADGSVVSRSTTGGSSIWSNSFAQLRLNPGDTIVIPDRTVRPSAVRNIMDWTTVISQLALGAAFVNVL